jgi:DNA polymerase III sliding clamp (beta) subunit (PCNA family)
MQSALSFVRGAVATKDLVPILTSFHIYDGRIQGCNGKLSIDTPCPDLVGFDFTVHAPGFLKAVDACGGEPTISQKEAGFLAISRGSFKARLPLSPHEEFPRQHPEGEMGEPIGGPLLPLLKQLSPFIGDDASRPWACGVLFRGGQAFATNNVVVAGVPAVKFERSLNLPSFLVDELLRIGKEPTSVLANNDQITFRFADGSWIKSSLLSAEWPPVENMLQEGLRSTIPEGLLSAVERILPFCPDPKVPLIFLGPDGVKTSDGDKSAVVEGFNLPQSAFRAEPLCAVLKVAIDIDFTAYPKPVSWSGQNGLRGLLVGVVT